MIYLEYTKQNFYTGQKLLASHLNHIEDGIANIRIDASLTNADQAADAKTVGDTINKLTTKIDKNTEDVNKNTKSVTSLNQSVSKLKEDLATKIDKPSTAPEVGKILKVTSVNADGTFVCEWANDNSGAVDDVQINNVSIVQDGVAKIPVFSNDKFGVVKLGNTATSGIRKDYDGTLVLSPPTKGYIDVRFIHSYGPIIPKILDYAVKKAMCDGLGEAWTDAERIAALLRMGCTVDDNGFVKWTAQEVAE